MYNAVPGNVVSHGAHPRYTHLLVNLPLLFGPLAPIFVVGTVSWLLDLCLLPWARKPAVRQAFSPFIPTELDPTLKLYGTISIIKGMRILLRPVFVFLKGP